MTVNLKISGKVQGVFFRKGAKGVAEKLRLVGWVRNNSGGIVEVLAVGPKEKLEEFVSWCRVGPPFAQVGNVEVEWQREDQGFESFEIV